MSTGPRAPDAVRDALAAAPVRAQAGLWALRALVLRVSAEEGIAVTEGLRWGQPAFLAPRGSTILIGVPKGATFALFVHCQTSLIRDFRAGPGAAMRFDGQRAVLFDTVDQIDAVALPFLIRRALRWHEKGRKRTA
jgi:hypothetical protein